MANDKLSFSLRKKPKQERSKGTVDAIITASIQVLNRGSQRLTTTTAADRAGVSVGSLYQYFPNKKAIVAQLVHYHAKDSLQQIRERVRHCQPKTVQDIVPLIVEFVVDYHLGRKNVYNYMTKFLFKVNGHSAIKEVRKQAVELFCEICREHQLVIGRPQLEKSMYIAGISVMGVIEYSMTVDNGGLTTDELKTELTALISKYLTQC